MTCAHCHAGEMEPTQVSRTHGGLGRTAYTAALTCVLIVGGGAGWVLALVGDGDLDLRAVSLVTLGVLLVGTPILIIGALTFVFREEGVALLAV